MFLEITDDGVIRDAAFDGQSCAIATASASLMTEALIGKTPRQARSLFDRLQALMTAGVEAPEDGVEVEPLPLEVLSGVRDYLGVKPGSAFR